MMTIETERRYVSGIQPSGDLHLGNYFGAIAQHLSLQHLPGDSYYFIADYHALTSLKDAEKLRQFTRQIAATYVALGLEPDKAVLFKQSDIPEVQELAWMLGCTLGMGVLQRCHAYKEKVSQGLQPNVGLFTYPVLMAADILIYGGTHIPVGKDQVQHIEVARDLATSFNSAFGVDLFEKPEAFLSEAPLIPGTDGRKMSKSYGNTIPIFGSKKQLKKKVSSIVTDSKNPSQEPLDPKTCNAFALLELVGSPDEIDGLRDRYLNDRTLLGYGVTKKLILGGLERHFGAAYVRYQELLNPGNLEIDKILWSGAAQARAKARETLNKCRRAVGLDY